MKNFAITGVAGYIAPRHLQAIKNTGNRLVAALDPHDSVSILDNYFPDSSFFTEFERFERHLEKMRHSSGEKKLDYISICSPNHLHDAHIRLALRIGADAICEKPLVLNPWNLDLLEKLEEESGSKVYTIMQLRLHPAILKLKQEIGNKSYKNKYEVELKYITSRGLWYDYSWKGTFEKSGGIATNIGIHLFDLVIWLFGDLIDAKVELSEKSKMRGSLALRNANVKWFLSTDKNDLPKEVFENGKNTYRSIIIDRNEVEFSEGFFGLHTRSYEEILKGNGFGIKDARPSLDCVYRIRNAVIEKSMIN